MAGNYQIGVTEEKVSNNKYYVTAKLESYSAVERARSMIFYHGALLAENADVDKFQVKMGNAGGWCQFMRNQKTGQRSVEGGGPKMMYHVNLANFYKSTKSNPHIQILNTADAKRKYSELLNAPVEQEQMKRARDRRLKKCWSRCF